MTAKGNWDGGYLAAAAPLSWGTTFIVTTEALPPGRPMLAATLRALPAGLLLLAVARALPPSGWWWRSAVLGTLNFGAFFALLFVAAYRLPGGVAATLGAVQPLLVAVLARWLLQEPLTRVRVVAGCGAIVGVGLLVLRADARLDGLGVLAGLAGTASMGAGVVLTKRWGRPGPLLAFTSWQLIAGGLLLAPLMLVVEGPPPALDATNLAAVAYLGIVGTAIAYALWFRGIGRLPAPAVSFLALLSPVMATALGAIILGESLTGLQTLGFALCMASIVAGQIPPRARPSRAAPPPASALPPRPVGGRP